MALNDLGSEMIDVGEDVICPTCNGKRFKIIKVTVVGADATYRIVSSGRRSDVQLLSGEMECVSCGTRITQTEAKYS